MTGDPNRGGVLHQGEARSITPDGKFVVGVYYDRTPMTQSTNQNEMWGFFYNTTNGNSYRPLAGSYAAYCSGVGYRMNPGGNIETIVDAYASGNKFAYMTLDGGATWGSKVRCTNDWNLPGPWLGLANTLGCKNTSDSFYSFIQGNVDPAQKNKVWPFHLYSTWGADLGAGTGRFLPVKNEAGTDYFQTMRFDYDVYVAGISADGVQVGYYRDAEGLYVFPNNINQNCNWAIGCPPPWMPSSTFGWMYPNYTNCFTWLGLDGATYAGQADCITPDSTTIFGHSPKSAGTPAHAYKFVTNSITWDGMHNTIPICEGVLSELPSLPGVAREPGTTWAETPFGCSADGRYAVGVSYVGTEKATLWDTGDPNPANWTATDLTAFAVSEGILGNFTKLDRAYSVGVNASGYPVVCGYGKYPDESNQVLTNRAFVMTIVPRPQITSITGAGTSSITVNYNNLVAGKLYTLQYSTDLTNPSGWNNVGTGQMAIGTSDSQTETGVTSDRRFYRVWFTP